MSKESAEEAAEDIIQVQNVWKVFGRESRKVASGKSAWLSKDEIRKKTGHILGLRDISFTVRKGEFFIIMGLSGSGKSTLIRHIIRLVNPTKGSIIVKGKNLTRMSESEILEFRKSTFGMVFQNYGLLPHLTVLENAAYGLKVRKLPKEERLSRAREALETVGLNGWEEYCPSSLSGGMQQRVGLARALASNPDILLMDEPFSGLDPLIRRQMQDELVALQGRLQKTIVFVTHDLDEALKLGDRIAILHGGELAQTGTPEEIVTSPANAYVEEFVQDASPAKVVSAGSIMVSPETLLYAWEGPQTALTILKKAQRPGAFVVDREQRLLGVANRDRLARYCNEQTGGSVNMACLIPEVVREVPAVREDTILEELFSVVTANPYPVPVVSDSGRLLGVVKTDDIFETISPAGGDEDV